MPLSTEERIATNGLLIEREAEYARVAGIEAQINQLLQGEYPLPVPDSIPPSCMKRKAPKAAKAKKEAKPKPIKLRRLSEEEYAYRYRWTERGADHEATTIDARWIDGFVKSPPEGVRILGIDTIDIEGASIEMIYSNE